MHKNQGPVYYSSYLKLEKLLASQEALSKKYGEESHDETLFIIVHQVYELWFKQILHEIDFVIEIFKQSPLEETALSQCVSKLERIVKIQSLLIDQLDVMETMTPMDFLEFRDLLIPASGFQSSQFREIEIKMGLSTSKRVSVSRNYFLGRLNEEDKKRIEDVEKGAILFDLVEQWLERIPFIRNEDFNFWDEYKNSVQKMLDEELKHIKSNDHFGKTEKTAQLNNFNETRNTFNCLLEKEKHLKLVEEGKRRMSQRAMLSALFILLYRDKPILNQPYKVLSLLMDIDENFTHWRQRHALMAHRMLGTKIGTGGSSGHKYLKTAAENNRVFSDLFDLSTFLIPRSMLPTLPKNIESKLNFHFSENIRE